MKYEFSLTNFRTLKTKYETFEFPEWTTGNQISTTFFNWIQNNKGSDKYKASSRRID